MRRILATFRYPVWVSLSVAVVVSLYSLTYPNKYTSESRILPVEARASNVLGGAAATAAALGIVVSGQEGSDGNFVDILNSRWIREELLNSKFKFSYRRSRFGAMHTYEGTLYGFLKAPTMDIALRNLAPMYSASRDLKTKIFTIRAETVSPELSQEIVQTAVQLMGKFIHTKSRTRGREKATYASARLLEAQSQLDQSQNTLEKFLTGNRNYLTSSDPSVRLHGTRLEMDYKLRQQIVSNLAVTLEQTLLEEKNDIPILNVLDPANLATEKSGPSRAKLVLLCLVASGVVSWGYFNRAIIKKWQESSATDQDGDRTVVV